MDLTANIADNISPYAKFIQSDKWKNFYSTEWEAIATFFILGVCAIIQFIFVTHTVFKLYLEDLDVAQDRQVRKDTMRKEKEEAKRLRVELQSAERERATTESSRGKKPSART